jgi:hypothetical protein
VIPYSNALVQPQSWILYDGGYADEPPTVLNNVKISEEDALAVLQKEMDALGLDGYAVAGTEKARIIKGAVHETKTEGWLFILMRGDGGIRP